MEQTQNNTPRPVNPRRRRRTKMDIFKESYLPTLLVAATIVFIIITIIGGSVQNMKRKKLQDQATQNAIAQIQADDAKLQEEADALLLEAEKYAADYDYDTAIATLQRFSGDISKYQKLSAQLTVYQDIKSKMVAWTPDQVVNLSFHVLIEDPLRAYADSTYGTDYNRNFISTSEFRIILDQLYKNGYILVSTEDLVSYNGSEMSAKTLYLPAGKKPLILTETHVNYYDYMIDGNNDNIPDKEGAGFASKLIVDTSGKILNQMVDKNGKTVTGEFDMVPILNSFIESHPDFSYRGAKAILAVTGDEGVFGYRINSQAKEYLSDATYQTEVNNAKKLVNALRNSGYEIACYTYANQPYGSIGIETLKTDLALWKQEVTPILGEVDILVFARESELSTNAPYSGDKFEVLKDFGFRYFFGFCQNGELYATVQPDYFRQARLMVTGGYLKYYSQWFEDMMNPLEILSSIRGSIPRPN